MSVWYQVRHGSATQPAAVCWWIMVQTGAQSCTPRAPVLCSSFSGQQHLSAISWGLQPTALRHRCSKGLQLPASRALIIKSPSPSELTQLQQVLMPHYLTLTLPQSGFLQLQPLSYQPKTALSQHLALLNSD